MRRHSYVRRARRANQQKHRPVIAITVRPAHRDFAALHRQLNLRQQPRRVATHRRLARGHRVGIFVPAPYLHATVFQLMHPQDSTLSPVYRPLFRLSRWPLIVQPNVQVGAIRRRPVAPMR